MTDYSFIRLLDDFSKAKDLQESPLAENSYYNQVHLLPYSETYLQITNTSNGISFQSDYTAYLVDCSNEVIEDITKHVFISEFTSSTGLQQIAFELVNLPTDHGYKLLFLRIESNSNPNYAFWSSPFICTDDAKELTTRFDYWSNSYYKGIDYTVSEKKQSIRLSAYFTQPLDETDISEYTEVTTGRTVGSRAIIKEHDNFFIEEFNGYFLRRLNVLLSTEFAYVNGFLSDYFRGVEFTERIDLSNIINTTFLVGRNYSNIFEFEYQIYEGLSAINFTPSSSYTIGNLPVNAVVVFNQNITFQTGQVRLYNSIGTLLHTWNETDLSFVGSESFQTNSDLNLYATTNDTYYFQIDSGIVKSTAGVEYEGINDTTTWVFIIGDADFNSSDFNNLDFFT